MQRVLHACACQGLRCVARASALSADGVLVESSSNVLKRPWRNVKPVAQHWVQNEHACHCPQPTQPPHTPTTFFTAGNYFAIKAAAGRFRLAGYPDARTDVAKIRNAAARWIETC